MLFNSAAFLFIFLPITWIGYWACASRGKASLAKIVLLAASCVFYAACDWRFLPLLLSSISVNHLVAVHLLRDGSRRQWALRFALIANLLVLGYFKYWVWVSGAFIAAGWLAVDGISKIVLPLGISFFTFHVISFLVDTYRGKAIPGSWLDSAIYFMFFPHLVAGPILSHRDFAPQLALLRLPSDAWAMRAVVLIVFGLAKKLLIADTLARYVVAVYWPANGATSIGFFDAWIAVAGYTAQLYYDFSAYCEIALGLAMLFGFRFPINFWSPYKSATIQEFWGRWHITLGAFLRDYVYIPLGGSKLGFGRGLIAVAIAFGLGGIWHGAGLTFLLWGCLHASYVVMFRLWQRQPWRLPNAFAVAITLFAVMFAWVPFRATDIHQAMVIWKGMVGGFDVALPAFVASALSLSELSSATGRYGGLEAVVLAVVFAWMLTAPNLIEYVSHFIFRRRSIVLLASIWLAVLFSLALPTEFLYFAF